MLDDIVQFIKNNKSFYITSHVNMDGDAVGSQLALKAALTKIGKKAVIQNVGLVPTVYQFLPFWKCIRTESPRQKSFDGIFVLDCGNVTRTGGILTGIKGKSLINIDHHMSNEHFGDLNWVDIGASSTCEMIYQLLDTLSIDMDRDIATCLYVGIITDTGSFRYANTNALCLEIASKLVKLGVDPKEVAEAVYEKSTFNKLKLLGLVLANAQISHDGLIVWTRVTKDMFRSTSTNVSDVEDFVNYLKSVRGAQIALLFRENDNGEIKVSFRSKGKTNVSKIAALFNGGGHFNAAGCTVSGMLDEVEHRVIQVVREYMDVV